MSSKIALLFQSQLVGFRNLLSERSDRLLCYLLKKKVNPQETERDIRFSFVNDTLAFASNSKVYALPEEVIEHLEKNRGIQGLIRRNKLVFGGVSVVALGLGGFIVYRRRRKK